MAHFLKRRRKGVALENLSSIGILKLNTRVDLDVRLG